MSRSLFGSMRAVALWSMVWSSAVSGAQAGAGKQVVSMGAPTLPACQVFVATGGNDGNAGTATSPFASLERARDYVRAHKAAATSPIVVCLRGGTYELRRTFTLGPEDSGTAAAPITYRSFPGERAILSGGVKLHLNWSLWKGAIQVADVDLWFNQLFVNGVRATRARTPNADANFFNLTPVVTYPDQPGITTANQTSFLCRGGCVSAGLSKSDTEIVSMERFQSPRQRVASTNLTTANKCHPNPNPDPDSSQVCESVSVQGYLDYRAPYGFDYFGNDRFYVENSLEALDSPGEWYLDERAHKLYYWPGDPNEIRDGEFIVPQLHQLVRGGSYPENTSWETQFSTPNSSSLNPKWLTCRHIGVYPKKPDSLSFAQDSFSVAAWLQLPAGATDPFWVFSKGDPLGDDPATGLGGHGYGLSAQSTAATVPLQFFVNDGTHRISTSLPPQPRGIWVHVVFVVDRAAKQLRGYVNGVLQGTEDISTLGSIVNTIPFDVGAYTNQSCSNSAIDNFLIYSIALSQAQIAGLASGAPPSTNGLALSLPLNGDFIDHSPVRNETVVFFAPNFKTGVAGMKAADFSTPFPSDLSGSVDYVGFSSLSFEYADWVMQFTGYLGQEPLWNSPSAVYLHSHNASIIGNNFSHLGSIALGGMLATSLVADNEFSDVGGGAIRIGQYSVAADEAVLAEFSSNDMITRNVIQNTGIVDRASFALWIGQGQNTTISRNTVSNAPFVGISESGGPGSPEPLPGNDRISFNRIDHVMQLLNDGGAIYVNGTQPGTSIDHNVVHDILKTPAHISDFLITGIYLDGGSRNFLVRDNLTYRVEWGGIFLNEQASGNAGNTITNNIFVDGVEDQLSFAFASQDSFSQNIVSRGAAPGLAQRFYDGRNSSTDLFNGQYLPPPPNPIQVSDHNLFFGPSVPDFAAQFLAWQALGYDAHSILEDPQFVDYRHDNFTLKPSSPAILPIGSGGIGFQPIDFTGLPQ